MFIINHIPCYLLAINNNSYFLQNHKKTTRQIKCNMINVQVNFTTFSRLEYGQK